MENEFKIPIVEPKVKFIPKKVKETNENAASDSADSNSSEQCTEETSSSLSSLTESGNAKSSRTEVETIKLVASKCPYVEPTWSQSPESTLAYKFEVLKSGQIVENIENLQTRAFWTIGKLPDNNIAMAHPTISRYHAVLQYRPDLSGNNDSSDSDNDEDVKNTPNSDDKPKSNSKVEKGWYLYDLSSTHGSFVNKMKIPPKTYVRVRVGYMLKFGGSTRSYILQGPDFDAEAESELTITELKDLRRKREQEFKEKLIEEEKRKEAEGVSWGMTDDAEDETDLSHNPFAVSNNEELFLQDPKKTLRGYFEREGFDLEYKVDELSTGSYVCKWVPKLRIDLPITDSMGRNLVAEFCHKGKKKDCVLQCALEACRILDRNGVLRQSHHEPQRRRKVESSDDDDDEFYDRTADAEEKRKRKAGAEANTAISYEQLMEKEIKLQEQITDTEQKISRYQQLDKLAKQKELNETDDLDDFMSELTNEKALDKTEIRKLRFELQRIKEDLTKTRKLINIARPSEMPPLIQHDKVETQTTGLAKKLALPLFGKKRTFGFAKPSSTTTQQQAKVAKTAKSPPPECIEEFDDDDDEEDDESKKKEKNMNLKVENEDDQKIQLIQTQSEKSDEEKLKKPDSSLKTPKCNSDNVQINPQSVESQEDTTEMKSSGSSVVNSITAKETTNAESEIPTSSNKKRRNRTRVRGGKFRDNIDINDTDERLDSDKYSKWVPPENQSGDGITDLNSKYGY